MGLRRIESSAKSKAGGDLPEPQPHTFTPVVNGPSPGLLQSAQANPLFCRPSKGLWNTKFVASEAKLGS